MESDDEILITEYENGNTGAFKTLIDRYTPALYGFSVRLAGSSEAADIVQEIFIKVWKNIGKFKPSKAHFKTWMFAIARNTITDHLRKKKAVPFAELDTEEISFDETLPSDDIIPDEMLAKIEDRELLERAVSRLSKDHQIVLTLYYQEDMTFREIAEVLGTPLNTVKSHHRRALETLRSLLS